MAMVAAAPDTSWWRRVAWHACLLLALVLAQQGGLRHELTHLLGGGDPDHASVLHADVCQDCLAHAALAHTATGGGMPAALALSVETEVAQAPHGTVPRACALATYLARAPPMSVST